MSAEAVLSAIDSQAVLVVGIIIVSLALLVAVAVIGHRIMIPVRKTVLGQWASTRTEARMDSLRGVFAARKRTKAGAQ